MTMPAKNPQQAPTAEKERTAESPNLQMVSLGDLEHAMDRIVHSFVVAVSSAIATAARVNATPPQQLDPLLAPQQETAGGICRLAGKLEQITDTIQNPTTVELNQ